MQKYGVRFVLFLVLVYQSLDLLHSRRVSLENNGYRGIKVLLPREISVENKIRVINVLKDLLTSASMALYIATKRRAYFEDVTFVIPSSWGPKEDWLPDNSNVTRSRLHYYDDTDIEITNEMKGTKPLTLHSGGCGEQALRIYLPLEFLVSEEDMVSKSRTFVHHWAQYRYGIFPEGGFESDSRYPLYYSVPGTKEVEVTSCTNVPLSYVMMHTDGTACEANVNSRTGRPEGYECVYVPTTKNVSLHSSLMYQQGRLSQMSQFCHGETEIDKVHHVSAPSKHNALCGEESTWFVILRNQDFLKGRNQGTKYRPHLTKYQYFQESSLRVVVALETSAYMSVNSRYSLVRNALAKLILYDLPSNTKFGLVSFSNEETVMDSLLTLETEETRKNFLESLPFEEQAGPHFNRCTTCAVNASMQLLQNDDDDSSEEGGVIILITAGSCESSSAEIMEGMLKSADNIRLFVILFSQERNSTCTWESFTGPTGGFVHHISEFVSTSTKMTTIYLAFESIVKDYSLPSVKEVLMAQEIPQDQTDFSLPIFVSNRTATELRVFITGPEFDAQNSPLVAGDTTITCGMDKEFTEFLRQRLMPAWIFDITSQQGSNCTFMTKRKEGVSDPVLIMVTQKWEIDDKPITVHAKTIHKNQKVSYTAPVKLFVDIRAGIMPIIDVKVVATTYYPNGDTSEIVFIDDGVGDPDVTRNDGIYSSYFTNFSTQGYYDFLFKISSTDTTKKLEVDTSNCCGSFMPSKHTEEVEGFNRLAGPLSLFLEEESPKDDAFPPNQLLDVRVVDVDLESRVYTFQWTAAGDDYNQEAASSYQLKIFPDRSELRYNFENTGIEIDMQRDVLHRTPPGEYGGLQEFVVRLPKVVTNGIHYLGVRAMDDAGNFGLISNTIPFLVSSEKEKEEWNKTCDATDPGNGRGAVRLSTDHIFLIPIFFILVLDLPHF